MLRVPFPEAGEPVEGVSCEKYKARELEDMPRTKMMVGFPAIIFV